MNSKEIPETFNVLLALRPNGYAIVCVGVFLYG
jgi:hypothetical protein